MKKNKQWIFVVVIVVLLVAIGVTIAFYSRQSEDEGPLLKADMTEEEEQEEKLEQHAPSIDIGDTGKFVKESPLSAAKEDEWASYY